MLLSGCGEDVVRDSAKLDRHLIPALAFTRQRDHARAMAAVESFEAEWQTFRKSHYENGDSTWRATFDQVDTMIADAAAVIEAGEYITDAYGSLDDIRMLLFEWREDNDIEYLVDPLHEFQEPLADLVRLVANWNPESLKHEELGGLTELLGELEEIWLDMTDVEFDIGRYGMTEGEAESFERLVGSVDYAISQLGGALEAGDRTRADTAVRELEEWFGEVYAIFGDFEPEE
ncbi:MAG: hypothetical protein JSU73_01455 [candidate division WOR-3 bacterium]|nr:MAG: hypothetical protein JSU73_01455 [candidate division WOR-3 bacterium]